MNTGTNAYQPFVNGPTIQMQGSPTMHAIEHYTWNSSEYRTFEQCRHDVQDAAIAFEQEGWQVAHIRYANSRVKDMNGKEVPPFLKFSATIECQRMFTDDRPRRTIVRTAYEHWTCECGNTPESSGFDFCNDRGERIEPEPHEWSGLYVCNECGLFIQQV